MMKGGKLINEKQLGVRMINLVLTVENSSAVLAVEISSAFFFLHAPKVGTEKGVGGVARS